MHWFSLPLAGDSLALRQGPCSQVSPSGSYYRMNSDLMYIFICVPLIPHLQIY